MQNSAQPRDLREVERLIGEHVENIRYCIRRYDEKHIYAMAIAAVSINILVDRLLAGPVQTSKVLTSISDDCEAYRHGCRGLYALVNPGASSGRLEILPAFKLSAQCDDFQLYVPLQQWWEEEQVICNKYSRLLVEDHSCLRESAKENDFGSCELAGQCQFCLAPRLTRKEIVKTVRDKYGAHVDPKISPKDTASRVVSWVTASSETREGMVFTKIMVNETDLIDSEVFFACIRQIASELMSSNGHLYLENSEISLG